PCAELDISPAAPAGLGKTPVGLARAAPAGQTGPPSGNAGRPDSCRGCVPICRRVIPGVLSGRLVVPRCELERRPRRPDRGEFDGRRERFAGVDAVVLGLELEPLADDVLGGRGRASAGSAAHDYLTTRVV